MGVDLIVLQQLAVAFGLGLLLGLQRERVESSIGGIRTFPLIALFGAVCALLGKTFGGWLVAAGSVRRVFTPWRSFPDSRTWTRLRFHRPVWWKVAAPIPPQAGARS